MLFSRSANYDFYRIDIQLGSPPGFLASTNLDQKTQDHQDILELTNARLFNYPRGYEITESLSADLLARFPKSRYCRVTVSPVLSKRLRQTWLEFASLDYTASRTKRNWESETSWSDRSVTVKTTWNLKINQGLSTNCKIQLATYEPPASETLAFWEHDYRSSNDPNLGHSRSEFERLGDIHPTFIIHRRLAESLMNTKSISGETTALNIAKLAFELADDQNRNKYLRGILVSIQLHGDDLTDPSVRCNLSLDRLRYEQDWAGMLKSTLESERHQAYIALGSNLGDRISLLESACREMNDRGLCVKKTSALYETKAMYLEDQQPFINGACEVSTLLRPDRLRLVLTLTSAD